MREKFNLSYSTGKAIAEYVEGSVSESVFGYRTASEIKNWFERLFRLNIDWPYGSSRWMYATALMDKMDAEGNLSLFFSKLLSFEVLRLDHKDKNDSDVAQLREKAIRDLNVILLEDSYVLKKTGNMLHLQKKDSDLELIGQGGFAEVYKIAGEDIVVKKLKDEHKANAQTVSRFKREYLLVSETLADIPGVIRGFDYNEKEISYTMEYCSMDLKKFLAENPISDDVKIWIVIAILETMQQVHQRGVIHRDISPKNVFLKGQKVLIADFGLGKDFHCERTLGTYDTSWQGTLEYCDPRLFSGLKKADYQSDIFSLGKLMNYIFTGSPDDDGHPFGKVAKKAVASKERRYKSVQEMLEGITQIQKFQESTDYEKNCKKAISEQKYNSTLDRYLLQFKGVDLLKETNDINFRRVYFRMIEASLNNDDVYNRLLGVHESLQGDTRYLGWNEYDGIAYLSLYVLMEKSIDDDSILEVCVQLIEDVAIGKNRYAVQDKFIENVENGRIRKTLVSEIYKKIKK